MTEPTQNLRQEVEETVRRELSLGGYQGSYTISEHAGQPNFNAGVDMKTLSEMQLAYNPAYEKKHPSKTVIVMSDIPKHEINHKEYRGLKGCPRNLENHVALIAEPISKVITPKGYGSQDIHYVANALEDTILHSDLGRKFKLEGITAFFEDIGDSSPNKKYTQFYEAHARFNAMLFGKKNDKKVLQKYFTNDKKARDEILKVLNDFFEEVGINELKYDLEGKKVRDKEKIRAFLNDETNWPKISTVYAKHFSKLMKPAYAMSLPNHSGKGTKGKEDDKPQKSEPTEGNEFDKAMEKPEYKKQRVQRAYSEDTGVPSWMKSYEALDMLYQTLAQRLDIKVQTFTQEMQKPIFYYGTRPIDPERDNLKHIGVGFNDLGQIEIKKKRWHENLAIPYKHHPEGFPKARFCLIDTSSSMKDDINNGNRIGKQSIIPWGDQSKYHFALLGWYGFLEYLKQNHLLSQTGVSIANISDKTLIADGLEAAKKLALTPQFGWTIIDRNKVGRIFEGRGNLVFTISDGGINNWDEVKDSFIAGAKKHHYFHLQIGGETPTSKDLLAANLKVEPIRGNSDLAKKVIDLTDILYRGEQ